jgi:hypothetical protein
MSFGLRNATQTFQRFMDDILRGLDFCFAYVEGILVFSRSLEEHEQHIRNFFDQLQRYGILINPAKRLSSTQGHLPRLQDIRRGFLEERVTHFRTATLPRPPVSSVDFWAC